MQRLVVGQDERRLRVGAVEHGGRVGHQCTVDHLAQRDRRLAQGDRDFVRGHSREVEAVFGAGVCGGAEVAVDVGLRQAGNVDGEVRGRITVRLDADDGAGAQQLLVLRSGHRDGATFRHDELVDAGQVGARIEDDVAGFQGHHVDVDAGRDTRGIEGLGAETDDVQVAGGAGVAVGQDVGRTQRQELVVGDGQRAVAIDRDLGHRGEDVAGEVDRAHDRQLDVAGAGEAQVVGRVDVGAVERDAQRAGAVVDHVQAVDVAVAGVHATQGDVGGAVDRQGRDGFIVVVGGDGVVASDRLEYDLALEDEALRCVDRQCQQVVVDAGVGALRPGAQRRDVASDDVVGFPGQQVRRGAGGVDGHRLQVGLDQRIAVVIQVL